MNQKISRSGTVGLLRADLKITTICAGWAVLSLGLFIVSGLLNAPAWQPILVSMLKVGAFLLAATLCWRNAQQTNILSGKVVWQAIALGLFFYALGDITAILWRSLWGIVAGVALADVFYGVAYLLLVIGLFQAVLPRRVSLNWAQTVGIAIIGIFGILLATWLNFCTPIPPSQTATLTTASTLPTTAVTTTSLKQVAAGGIAPTSQSAPDIVNTIEQRLQPISRHMGLVYASGDCLLLVISAAMLVAFWGGQYSETWKLVALASLCLYVADMFLLYQVGRSLYRPGSYWEIFWILSALCFGLSASIEHSLSKNMTERSPRRQWI